MLISFIKSTIGRKYIMGMTGLVWALFVFAHMAGNMLIFVGPDAYNKYGHLLTSGYLIYFAEAVLITTLVVHVACAISLTLDNRRARGNSYAVTATSVKGASVASRTMAIQGSLILFFIITHLITFKFGPVYTTTVDGVVMRDLHKLMVEVFASPAYVVWYVVALLVLCLHLYHGFGSIFQSFGIKSERNEKSIAKLSWGYAVVVVLGFLSQPLYVFFMI